LIYIYGKSIKRIKLAYFLKYKKQVYLLKYNKYMHNRYYNKAVHNRLFYEQKKRQYNMEKLSQKFLLDEAEKYTYFPEINKYDLIFKKYYIVRHHPYKSVNTLSNIIDNNNLTNPNVRYVTYTNEPMKNEEKKTNVSILNEYKQKSAFPNFNNFDNNKYINSMIRKKISILKDISKEEGTMKPRKNRENSKIIHYKNTIPNNYKKIISKTVRMPKANKSFCSFKINQKNLNLSNNSIKNRKKTKNKINNKKRRNIEINYECSNFHPSNNSHIGKGKSSDIVRNKNNSRLNSEIYNDDKSTKINSKKNTLSINNLQNSLIYSNNNTHNYCNDIHYKVNSELPQSQSIGDYYKKNQITSYSYKNLPKNECSLSIQGRRNNTRADTNGSKNNYNKLNLLNINKIKPFSSIGGEGNSVSTNFIDRPSQNEFFNSIINENQHSFIYNKYHKNTSYLFPSKEFNSSITNKTNKISDINTSSNNIIINMNNSNKNESNKKEKHFRKISELKKDKTQDSKIWKQNSKKIFDYLSIPKKVDKNNGYSVNNGFDDKENKNNKFDEEKLDEVKIIKKINDAKKNILNNLEMSSIANENVKNKKLVSHEKKFSTSEKSEPITIQSMNDSKIFEIANYYLNEEETVDRIEINDILSNKNNKNYYSLKENKI
jgi:hypothetical protein